MSFLPLPHFDGDLDDETLASHRISKKPNGEFRCDLCWKNPTHKDQVLAHLKSKEHQQRMSNEQYAADPLSFVPLLHREFTHLVNGWPTCTICDRRMDESHWNSERHMAWVNHYLQQRISFGSVGSVPLVVPDTSSRLSQPPPPPGSPPSKLRSPLSQPPPPAGPPPHDAQTLHFSGGDVLSAGSVAPGTPSLPPRPLPPGCYSSVSASGGAHTGFVSSGDVLSGASVAAGMFGPGYACGSRNDDEWNQIVRDFDKRRPAEWWPCNTKWFFAEV